MLFNSFEFLMFFTVSVCFFFMLPHKFRLLFLLATGWYFYSAWRIDYVPLIVFSTVIDYYSAIYISKNSNKKKRTLGLLISVVSNLSILFVFKYFNFIANLINRFADGNQISGLDILLPVGISFYTFQTLSYTIDVYRNKLPAEKNFIAFAAYVSYFPQLVAGPIERAENLLPQIKNKNIITAENLSAGFRLMLWGYFQKLVIADNAALIADIVFENPQNYKGLSVLIGTFMFGAQILMDFSGYTSIALGAARIMGINLVRNFKNPYAAQSLSEFWKRWHISLSQWFRDYVYIPLGGSKKGKKRYYLNVFITMTISGLWHGAGLNFILWGALHGIFYITEQVTRNYLKMNNKALLFKILAFILTFTAVHFLWIFFRANSVSNAGLLITNALDFSNWMHLSFNKYLLLSNIAFILVGYYLHHKTANIDFAEYLAQKKQFERLTIYILMLLALLFFGNFNLKEFVYFQF